MLVENKNVFIMHTSVTVQVEILIERYIGVVGRKLET